MVDAGAPVGGGRTFVEDPLGGSGPAAQALTEHVVGVPPVLHLALERDEIEGRDDGIEGHPGIVPAARDRPGAEIGA